MQMCSTHSASSGGGFAPRVSSPQPCAEPPGRGLAAERDVWGQELLPPAHLACHCPAQGDFRRQTAWLLATGPASFWFHPQFLICALNAPPSSVGKVDMVADSC